MTTPPNVTQYDLHDLVTLVGSFVGTDGVEGVMPSQMFVFVKNPLGTVASYLYGDPAASVLALASNAFQLDVSADLPGKWYYRFQATGIGQAAEEWTFSVASSRMF